MRWLRRRRDPLEELCQRWSLVLPGTRETRTEVGLRLGQSIFDASTRALEEIKVRRLSDRDFERGSLEIKQVEERMRRACDEATQAAFWSR